MFVGMRQSLGHALDSKKRDAEAAVSAWTEMVRCGHLSVQGFVGPRACPDMKFRGGVFDRYNGEFSAGIDKCGEIPKTPALYARTKRASQESAHLPDKRGFRS
jgi:hypothetical protein